MFFDGDSVVFMLHVTAEWPMRFGPRFSSSVLVILLECQRWLNSMFSGPGWMDDGKILPSWRVQPSSHSDDFSRFEEEQNATTSSKCRYTPLPTPHYKSLSPKWRLNAVPKCVIWRCVFVMWTNVDKIRVEAQNSNYLWIKIKLQFYQG